MAHISELALFEHIAGEADLTPNQLAHLNDCSDCAELEIEFRQVIQNSGDLAKAKRLLVEEEELPPAEPPWGHEHPQA
jgi:hypothetical protein